MGTIKTEISYTLYATHDNGHTFQLGKELSSPKMIVSSLKKQAFPPDFSEFAKLTFCKNVKTVETEIVEVDTSIFK
jgi:hypothetical protein